MKAYSRRGSSEGLHCSAYPICSTAIKGFKAAGTSVGCQTAYYYTMALWITICSMRADSGF